MYYIYIYIHTKEFASPLQRRLSERNDVRSRTLSDIFHRGDCFVKCLPQMTNAEATKCTSFHTKAKLFYVRERNETCVSRSGIIRELTQSWRTRWFARSPMSDIQFSDSGVPKATTWFDESATAGVGIHKLATSEERSQGTRDVGG